MESRIKEKTLLEIQREKAWSKVEKNWNFLVATENKEGGVIAHHEELDEVLHKIKLDLITMGTTCQGKAIMKVILVPKGIR